MPKAATVNEGVLRRRRIHKHLLESIHLCREQVDKGTFAPEDIRLMNALITACASSDERTLKTAAADHLIWAGRS